jgi:DNA-directed RNA polymerase subunit N (RpoN/RPB10)
MPPNYVERDKLTLEKLRETTRREKEQADKLAIENAVSRREMVSVVEVAEFINRVFTAFKGRILAANLELEDKDQILRELGNLLELANPDGKADTEPAAQVKSERVGDAV